jgi:transmembrane 9 superfamily protein 2/4
MGSSFITSLSRLSLAALVTSSLWLLLLSTPPTHGFYVPGVQPKNFKEGEILELKVNALTSTHTQIPRDYYRLPFCQPEGGPKMASENLGEFLTGNKIQNSPYSINMLKEMYCEKLCQIVLDKPETARLRLHIKYDYHNNWIIDNMPSATIMNLQNGMQRRRYAGGFPIGFMDSDKKQPYIYNHVNIHIDYHEMPNQEGYRVVGFAVEPLSVHHEFEGNYEWDGEAMEGMNKPLSTCPNTGPGLLERSSIREFQAVKAGQKILFTYGVTWNPSEIEWSSRWDVYLSEDGLVPAQVHWYSITNSILVVLFLSLLVVSILVRNLRRDIAAYNALATLADEEQDEDSTYPLSS